jgi:TolB-like protein
VAAALAFPVALGSGQLAVAAPTTEGSGAARTAILPLAVTGEMSDADRDALTRELVGGLERGDFGVIPPAEVATKAPQAAKCGDAPCFIGAAKATGATHVVRTQVVVQDRDYKVEVQLVDGATGTVLARSSDGCEICGIVDAGGLISSAAATLRTKLDALAKGPSTLSVVSDPAEAVVTIDGEIVGATPLERPVIPGKHIVRVTKDGYISIEREATFVEGVQESLRFELEKVPSRLPARPWGWASLFVGLAGMGAGFGLVAMHDVPYKLGENCTGNDVDPSGECRYLYDTKWYGVAAAAAGAAIATLGVAILLTTTKRAKGTVDTGSGKSKSRGDKKARKGSAALRVGPGTLMLQGRF